MTYEVQTIRNIWAVGRNYEEHAKELGNLPPAPNGKPMIFLKAGTSIVPNGASFELPPFSKDVHHEVEVALQFGSDFKWRALSIAIDLTARDVQNELKSKGHPWTLAKSFRHSCLLGPLIPIDAATDLQNLDFSLHINGKLRQSGNTRDMIHSVENLRHYVLEHFPVSPGDLLLTGTPAGVGPITAGDELEAQVTGLVRAHWRAASPHSSPCRT